MVIFINQVSLIMHFTFGIIEIGPVYHELSKNETVFLETYFTPLERQLFTKFLVEKRKTEWLGGRLAAKQAFRCYQERYGQSNRLDEINILNDSDRAPFIAGHTGLTLSISHAGDYAVAVLARFPIGVDIERITGRPRRFSDYFLCREEQERIAETAGQPEKTAELYTYFWTRKEATSKLLKKGGSLSFKAINTCRNVAQLNGGAINRETMEQLQMKNTEIRLFSQHSGQYYLSLAVNI